MLQNLHKHSTGLFAKTLLFLLIAALGLWGIGDIFSSTPTGSIAKVGNSKITPQEFQNEYAKEQQSFRGMLGNNYSDDLMKSLNIPEQVMQRLIQRHLVQEETRALNIEVPESYVKKLLKENPSFHGDDGQFDATLFRNILADNRMTESMFVELLRQDTASKMLMESLFSESSAPKAAIDLLFRHQYEKRTADILLLPSRLISNIPAPTDADLATYFEKNAHAYTAPELRSFTAIVVDYKKLSDAVAVSDDELLIAYQEKTDEFHQPETRDVDQLIFSDKEQAVKALNALKAGASMSEVKTTFNALNEEIELGALTNKAILPEAEKAVFLASEGSYSDPVESNFGWHVFYVKSINTARTQPFSEVRDHLAEQMRSERAEKEIYELSTRLQDDISAGVPLSDIAKNASIKTLTFGPLQKSGKAADGTEVKLPEGFETMLETAFSTDEGKTSNLEETPSGSLFAVQVDHIMPQRVKALDEIRATVTEDWNRSERTSRLDQLATGIAGNLASENIIEVAAKTGGTLIASQEVSRSTTKLDGGQELPNSLLAELFNVSQEGATAAYSTRDGDYMIAKLRAIHPADEKADGISGKRMQLAQEIATQYQEEIFQKYLTYLQEKHGVSEVNRDILNQLLPK